MVGNRLRCDLGSRSKECTQNRSVTAPLGASIPSKTSTTGTVMPKSMSGGASLKLDHTKLPKEADQEFIKEIQSRLKVLGLYEGIPDGKFGPETALALEVLKISKGLSRNGQYLDKKTLIELGINSE